MALTTNLQITLLETNTLAPEVQVNTALNTLDAVTGGRLAKSGLTGGTVTLTTAEQNNAIIELTGTLTSNLTIQVAARVGTWIFFNNTTGAFTCTVKVTGQTGVVIEQGWRGYRLYCDATDVRLADKNMTGKQMLWIPARDWQPSATGGCAALATIASAAGQPDIQTLDFDTTTQESAQYVWSPPRDWNLGTVTFEAIWSHASTATNFGVAWQLQGLAVSDNEAIPQNFGTVQTVTDTGGTTDRHYRSPESAAITIAGTPAQHDTVFLRLLRDPANGADTLAIDARLVGVRLFYTTF